MIEKMSLRHVCKRLIQSSSKLSADKSVFTDRQTSRGVYSGLVHFAHITRFMKDTTALQKNYCRAYQEFGKA